MSDESENESKYREARRKADQAWADFDFVFYYVVAPFMVCMAIYAVIQGVRLS